MNEDRHGGNVIIEPAWHRDEFDIYILEYQGSVRWLAKPIDLVFEEVSEGYRLPEPTMRINSLLAHMLFPKLQQELIRLGFQKPDRELEEREKELAAVKFHLEDMRKLVFKGK